MDLARVVKFQAIMIAAIFGCFGVHRFFLRTQYRWLMLIFGILGLFIGITLVVNYIWAIIDIIRMASTDDVEKLFPPESKEV